MPLPLEALESAVRITTFGDLLGTGFLVRVPSEAGLGSYSYLVTAHHVIKDQVGIEVEVPNPFTNGALYPSVSVSDWRQPWEDVDLAVAPYVEGEHRNHHAFWSTAIWPGHPDLGSTIYYTGMFEPLDRPVARSGTVAAIEQEGIPHSGGVYDYPAHLVDCRSYTGFSGSPCSMELAFAKLDSDDVPEWVPANDFPLGGMQYYTLLCGMFTAHYSDEEVPDAEGAVSRYGVGVMLPGRLIVEALMSDDADSERREWDSDRAAEQRRNQPPLKDAGGGGAGDEFSQFVDLTGKLIQVPKKEIDKKRERES